MNSGSGWLKLILLVRYQKAILVDTMPFHYEAMKAVVKEPTDIELDERTFYLLEGMPINEMAHQSKN